MSSEDSVDEHRAEEPTPGGAAGPAHDDATAQVLAASTTMLRGGLWPGAVVGVAVIVVAALVAGVGGAVAALVGAVLALGICSLGPLVMRWTAAAEPAVVMGAAMISFVTKIGLLAILFLVLGRLGVVDPRWLGLGVGAAALVFIAGETIAFSRSRAPSVAA